MNEELRSLFNDIERVGFASYFNDPPQKPRPVKILDSTLREGEQSPGISFTMRQRLQIAWMLDYFGVNAIEISPVISESHLESCKKLLKAGLSARIVAHLRALKEDIDVALKCDADYVAIYHSVSDIHLKYKLKVGREEAIRRTLDAVDYSKSHGLYLRVTLEDASRADPKFIVKFAKEMEKAKVDRISVPDTVGIMRPAGMYKLIKLVRANVSVPIDIHCHNDLGLALANALAGYEAGADQIHVTINGLGERVGITDLSQTVVSLLAIYGVRLNVRYDMLQELSELIETYTGFNAHKAAPLIGRNAYKHKAGTHIAAVINNPKAYEVIPPYLVGNRRTLVFGELLGKNGAAFFLKLLGMIPNERMARKFAQGMKKLQKGDLFELQLTRDMEKLFLEVNRKVG
jgi:2-isopropylmalate synthase